MVARGARDANALGGISESARMSTGPTLSRIVRTPAKTRPHSAPSNSNVRASVCSSASTSRWSVLQVRRRGGARDCVAKGSRDAEFEPKRARSGARPERNAALARGTQAEMKVSCERRGRWRGASRRRWSGSLELDPKVSDEHDRFWRGEKGRS